MWPTSTPATARPRSSFRRARAATAALLLGLSLGLALGLAGCAGKKAEEEAARPTRPTSATTANWEDYEDKIQRQLFELAVAPSPGEAAKAQGLEAFWAVRVVLVLASPDTKMPEGFRVVVEERFGEEVQAWVAVDDLLELAQRPEVAYIRAPVKPKPYGP